MPLFNLLKESGVSIDVFRVVLDTAASAGENVADALTMVMEIRQHSKTGSKDSQEQVSTKMSWLFTV